MFCPTDKFEATQDELAVIRAALETQAKILNVQASAGGSGARRRLNEVKKVLANVSQHTGSPAKPSRRFGLGWLGATGTT